MAEYPAMPLWTDAYLADTRHLSTEEHGAYLLLLMEAWRRPTCALPDDENLLARLAGMDLARWRQCHGIVMAFWNYDSGTKTWTQSRLLRERKFVARKSAAQSRNASKRWKQTKKDDAMALPDAMPSECQPDAPTPTPTPTIIVGGGGSAGDPQAPTFRERIMVAIGVGPDGITGPSARVIGTAADMQIATRWREELGLTEDEIVAVITETMVTKTDGLPSSFKYFNLPMQRVSKAKTDPLPEPSASSSKPGSRRHGRSAFNSAINATAEHLSAGTVHLDTASRDPFAR